MKRYRIRVSYPHPPLERSAVLEAASPQQAMVQAVLGHYVPAMFGPDEHGWYVPIWWHPTLAGRQRWPRVRAPDTLVWGDAGHETQLRFEVEEIVNDEPA